MPLYNDCLRKATEISNTYTKNLYEELEAALQCLNKFQEEFQNNRKAQDDLQKKSAMTTLQSINEDDDESTKTTTDKNEKKAPEKSEERGSKKRSKGEVDDMFSPELEKRQKRNASVKAQSIISKQGKKNLNESRESVLFVPTKDVVNVNLTEKLRREDDTKTKRRRAKEDDKENTEPLLVQIKQEKVSLPPEPMDLESLPLNVEIKQEVNKDEVAMPPPAAPVPKTRKGAKSKPEEPSEEESSGRRLTTRTKQTDTVAPTRQSSRSTRASSRASSRAGKTNETEEPVITEARPKRTRAKRMVAESSATDNDKDKEMPLQENVTASPAEKPRPKRTRKGQKAVEKEIREKPIEKTTEDEPVKTLVETQVDTISPKEEKLSQPPAPVLSPVLSVIKKTKQKNENGKIDSTNQTEIVVGDTLDATKLTPALNTTVTISHMDTTMVLPNGLYNHAPVTPKPVPQLNETVVLEGTHETHPEPEIPPQSQPQHAIMDATVILDRDTKPPNVTEDDSLLTDDEDCDTPPRPPHKPQPLSAVKEKVQQFEEMATRQTRTKTRAMAKKEEPEENQTPPDKVSKALLAETLSKMNSMIFNGKQLLTSSSASKLQDTSKCKTKSYIPSSTSKLSVNKTKDSAEEQRREKEDAIRKKEALLEAKREMQKRKREEKMAAAAAARSAAERSRRAAQEAAARERLERQAHADQGRLERLREVEKKKLELARKAAETEERRRQEEAARQLRADELRRAETARRRQLDEAEALKKEAALMDKEIERRQREFLEKQKLKQKMDGSKMLTPLKTPGTPVGALIPPIEPVYMADGFEYLNSDEEAENEERPIPAWSTSKAWKQRLAVQARVGAAHVDRLFSVRAHTPDLREIFPGIERARLKRTSSAVWRTPPRLPALAE